MFEFAVKHKWAPFWPSVQKNLYLYASNITNRPFIGWERFLMDVIHNPRAANPSNVLLCWMVNHYVQYSNTLPIFQPPPTMCMLFQITLSRCWLGITKWWYSDHHYCTFMDDMSDDSLWTRNIRVLMKVTGVDKLSINMVAFNHKGPWWNYDLLKNVRGISWYLNPEMYWNKKNSSWCIFIKKTTKKKKNITNITM